MLHQELPPIASRPLDGGSRWLLPAIGAAAVLSLVALWWLVGPLPALLMAGLAIAGAVAGGIAMRRPAAAAPTETLANGPDFGLVGAALALCQEPAAITSADGALLAANEAYRIRFDAVPPLNLSADQESNQSVQTAVSMAWRDGAGCVAGVATLAGTTAVEVQRAGLRNDMLLWRYPNPPAADPMALAVQGISGVTGERLSRAGVLAALVDGEGRVLAANKLFADRAIPDRASRRKVHASPTSCMSTTTGCSIFLPKERRGRASGGPCSREPGPAERYRHVPFVRRLGGSGSSANLQALLGHASDRPRVGRSRRPLPDHEPGVPHRRRA